jgi:formylglycine-generating enzyme required for sulfatase activity
VAGAALLLAGAFWARWAFAQAPAGPFWDARDVVQGSPARVAISGGYFVLGSDDKELSRARSLCGSAADGGGCEATQFAAEQPAHRVYVRPFAIDRLEVSNAEHWRCVGAGRCLPARADGRADLPVVQLTWRQARDYCRFVGGDLPSEAQWEYAAHGSSARSFPWGVSFDPQLGAFQRQKDEPDPVSAHREGKSFFGLLNMAGNVWEFALDRYRGPYASELPSVDPVDMDGLTSGERVLRGGSWRSPPAALRARHREAIREDEARADVGLRCAYPREPSR